MGHLFEWLEWKNYRHKGGKTKDSENTTVADPVDIIFFSVSKRFVKLLLEHDQQSIEGLWDM